MIGRTRCRVRISATGRAFVDLVHGRADEAELDHRAERADEAGVGGAAGGGELRRRAGDVARRRRRRAR